MSLAPDALDPRPHPPSGGTPAHAPRLVSWNVTAACNLRCSHCYLDGGRRRRGELSTRQGLRLIDQLAEAGTEMLILTGGEPLLRRDLPGLASHAARKGMAVVLGTNGTLIDGARARLLRESGVVAAGISLDSLDPARHDAFRGLPGAWRRAVAGMEACLAEGIGVLVHTTALRMNEQEIPGLARFAYERGARAFHLFFLVCTGRGERLTDLSPRQYERLLDWIVDAQDLYPGMMVRARCAPYIRRVALERGSALRWSAGCLAGTSYCRITPAGDVTPCPYLSRVAGNVQGTAFRQLWDSSPLLAELRPPLRLSGKCGRCPLSQGHDPLCVGCRARALALAGDELGADPWCLYRPETSPGASAAAAILARAASASVDAPPVAWTPEARERLGRVPVFVRRRVEQAAEAYAAQHGLTRVTTEVLDHLRQRAFGAGGCA